MSTSFAEELRARRLTARLSQVELADAARVSASAIGSYERGIRKSPHRQTISMLADALGLSDCERLDFEAAARATHRFGRRTSRQRTVEGLSLSYASLTAPERLLFRRLGTFPGAFTIADICGACTGPELSESQALDALSGLAKRTMIAVDERAGTVHYRLPVAARAIAIERAIESGELAANLRASLGWALGTGANPALAAAVVQHVSLGWLARPERLKFLNWLGSTLLGADFEEVSNADIEACWSILADQLEREGESLQAVAARKCATALGRLRAQPC